jgi:hypothetical protein
MPSAKAVHYCHADSGDLFVGAEEVGEEYQFSPTRRRY